MPSTPSTGTHVSGFASSINASGCVVINGDDSTQNIYYDGGTTTLLSSYAKPMAEPTGAGKQSMVISYQRRRLYVVRGSGSLEAKRLGGYHNGRFQRNHLQPGYSTLSPAELASGPRVNNAGIPQVVGYAGSTSGTRTRYLELWRATATGLDTYAVGSWHHPSGSSVLR